MSKVTSPSTSEEFEDYYRLRWEILRRPWNQPPGSEKDGLEDSSHHFMIVENNRVVAVGRLHALSPTVAQIRYMAVDDNYRCQGHGSTLLTAIEQFAISNHFDTIQLHARELALGFYQCMGYSVLEQSHLLYDEIQHFLMEKQLPRQTH